ncbi:hypothetical protein JCM3775_006762 [Rhodotorula graminis]|uniref:F-box domain-containing protein n=1 Tax=Rhodotorula graminis (strain WP1) TaxID=578459 RepID=A0A194S8L7_RHOGW|nr:uncharacterized protein RHOBADRAFT_52027 [Rhodotorula graminis WP1]KPV77068.1 hypothetical protein RHOBADRAFT_52027 [Rhodotorula graminis WP1]
MPPEPRLDPHQAAQHADTPPSSIAEAEVAKLMDVGESASGTSSSRQGSVQKDKEDKTWSQGDDPDDEPARKKARTSTDSSSTSTKATTKGKGKGRAGKLSTFLAMPLDILVEISRHLDPLSLLYMSRANKMMHSVFARRSAAPIWASARANVDLPALEATDLSEMQLASLVFERNCHLCGRGRASIVDYALSAGASLCSQSELGETKIKNLHVKTLECSLFTSVSRYSSNIKFFCKPDVQATSDKLHELDARTLEDDKTRKEQGKVEDGNEVKADEVAVNALDAFVQRRRENVAAAQKDAEALVKWENSSSASRKEISAAARKARRDAITASLVSLGYKEVDYADLLSSSVSKLVDQPTQLTDKIWMRISPKIIEYVEAKKVDRISRERSQQHGKRLLALLALKPRYEALLALQVGEAHMTFPSWDVFNILPSVEPFWFFEDADTSDEAWDTALPAIVDEVDVARRVIKIGYARKLVEVFVDAGAPVDAVLVKKLAAPAEPVHSTGALLSSIDQPLEYAHTYGPLVRAIVDLGDTADTVTDAEFDSVFGQLFAWFSHYSFGAPRRFPEIHAFLRDHWRSALADTAWSAPATLVKQVLNVLKRAGVPNHQSSGDKLSALGPVFECHGCKDQQPESIVSNGVQVIVNQAVTKSWFDLITHAFTTHSHAYSTPAVGVVPEIRLLTPAYLPSATVVVDTGATRVIIHGFGSFKSCVSI